MATTTASIATASLPMPFAMIRLGPGGYGKAQFFSIDQVRSMAGADDLTGPDAKKRKKELRDLLGATAGHP